MIGLVMAGGNSARTNYMEKLAIPVYMPVVLRVVNSLVRCPQISHVYAAVSKCAPKTRQILQRYGIDTIETKGEGYSVDLSYTLDEMTQYTLILPGDLPFLDADIISRIVKRCSKKHWTNILVTERYAAMLCLSPGITTVYNGVLCRYTGISAVEPAYRHDIPARYVTINDMRIAANLNSPRDWALLGAAYNLAKHNGLGTGGLC